MRMILKTDCLTANCACGQGFNPGPGAMLADPVGLSRTKTDRTSGFFRFDSWRQSRAVFQQGAHGGADIGLEIGQHVSLFGHFFVRSERVCGVEPVSYTHLTLPTS